MKKLSTLLLALLTIVSVSSAQQRQSGQNLGPDKQVINAPDNAQWLNKQGRVNPMLNTKSVYFFEGFETPTEAGALPEGWVQKRTTSLLDEPTTDAESPKWFRNSAEYGFTNGYEQYVFAGAASMAIGYTAPDFTWAISPSFTIPETEGDVNLKYWAWLANNAENGWLTNYYVRVKDGNGDWLTLYSYFGGPDNDNQFETELVHSLNAFKNQEIQIAFVYEYTDGYQVAIDNVYVGETLYDDFGLENFNVYPYFSLLENDEVTVSAEVFCNGVNDGSTDVSLVVNGTVEQTVTTGVLTQYGDTEFVEFIWTAPAPGSYTLAIELAEDDFIGNNYDAKEIFVNPYVGFAEDFENFEFDELGIPTYVWPPSPDWDHSENVGETNLWPIFDEYAARISGMLGDPEQFLSTPAITLTAQDNTLSFYLAGVNNNLEPEPGVFTGYSTFQLKYSDDDGATWNALGAPIEFLSNANRMVKQYIGHLSGDVKFAFTATSNFDFEADGIVYNSHVMVDNILITEEDVTEVTFTVVDEEATPVEAATVTVYVGSTPVQQAETNVDGQAVFTLPEGDYNYEVAKFGFTAEEDAFTAAGAQVSIDVTLTLPEVFDITFVVVDADQNPVEGATITIEGFTGDTNAEGAYTFSGFAPESYAYEITAEGFNTYNGTATVVDENLTVNVTLSPETSAPTAELVKVAMYPNPASSTVRFQTEAQIISVEVYNTLGAKVMESGRDLNAQLNIESLSNGLYIVKINTSKGIAIEKLQVNR